MLSHCEAYVDLRAGLNPEAVLEDWASFLRGLWTVMHPEGECCHGVRGRVTAKGNFLIIFIVNPWKSIVTMITSHKYKYRYRYRLQSLISETESKLRRSKLISLAFITFIWKKYATVNPFQDCQSPEVSSSLRRGVCSPAVAVPDPRPPQPL